MTTVHVFDTFKDLKNWIKINNKILPISWQEPHLEGLKIRKFFAIFVDGEYKAWCYDVPTMNCTVGCYNCKNPITIKVYHNRYEKLKRILK